MMTKSIPRIQAKMLKLWQNNFPVRIIKVPLIPDAYLCYDVLRFLAFPSPQDNSVFQDCAIGLKTQ